jgi:hypothetical protein
MPQRGCRGDGPSLPSPFVWLAVVVVMTGAKLVKGNLDGFLLRTNKF